MSGAADWKRSLRLLWGAHFLSTASLTAIAPFLPMYMEEMGGKEDALLWSGLALAVPALSYALTAPLWGKLGDRIGRKWMVVRASIGIAAVLAAMGFAQTPAQLLALRLLQGVLGGVVDAGVAFAGGAAPENERGKALGKLEGAVAAGSLAGPLIIGLFWGTIGFRTLLLLFGGLLMVWSVAAAIGLKESGEMREQVRERASHPASVPVVLRRLLADRRCGVFLMAGICANIGAYGLLSVFAPHVNQLAGDASGAAVWLGILQGVTWAASWAAASWWGKRNDSVPVERNFAIAAAVCGVAVMLQAAVVSPEWLIPLRLLQGFGFSALLQSVYLVVVRTSGADNRGASIGSASSLLVTGQIAGPLMGGLLAAWFSPAFVFVQFGAVFVFSAFLVLVQARVALHSPARATASETGLASSPIQRGK
ncbi:MFS transporter [Paenibacillus sp. LHD-117]|uniref:MFS transporter n=1 Tax=Paenibacillus sp. LHD-117 TaxID=3071412 RepID=UPI0027E014E9|nr:MFS transporter [Paenibacillus sp. LHD-117]MDQ6421980.1 MFS transporter [Paenibacillus sp. LHD-117]